MVAHGEVVDVAARQQSPAVQLKTATGASQLVAHAICKQRTVIVLNVAAGVPTHANGCVNQPVCAGAARQ